MLDVIIIGGGLSGLIAAIKLSGNGFKITLIEKKKYPFQRVCGEYISNEVLPFMESLDISAKNLGASEISRLSVSSHKGKQVFASLPLGGFGISRFKLDHHLIKMAIEKGVQVLENTMVEDVEFIDRIFNVKLSTGDLLKSHLVIGAYGKRTNLDRKFNRPFFSNRSPYLGVKYHITGDFDKNTIALHNFSSGYCGLNKIEDDKYCLCYLTSNEHLKKYSLEELEEKVLFRNPYLKDVFKNASFVFKKPEIINEVSFEIKGTVERNVIMVGDAVGMISPLCGNGMAMAIHSGKILADIIIAGNTDGTFPLVDIQQKYSLLWDQMFKTRLIFGRYIQSLYNKEYLTSIAMTVFQNFDFVFREVIKRTHGQPFK